MPEILKKPDGNIDWNKFFMGFAVSVVFVLQSYSQMQHNEVKQEVDEVKEKAVTKCEVRRELRLSREDLDIVLEHAMAKIDERLDNLEVKESDSK